MQVSLFNFKWTDVYGQPEQNLYSRPTLRDEHDRFNAALRSEFPRLLYSGPFSSYRDSTVFGLVAGSRLYALGETSLSPNETKEKVRRLAESAGVRGSYSDITFDQKSLGQIQAGERLRDPGTGVNPLFTGNVDPFGILEVIDDIPKPGEIPWWVYAGGAVILVALLRR